MAAGITRTLCRFLEIDNEILLIAIPDAFDRHCWLERFAIHDDAAAGRRSSGT